MPLQELGTASLPCVKMPQERRGRTSRDAASENAPATHSKEKPMPLVRVDLAAGKTPEYRNQVGQIVYQSMMDALNVPQDDRFLIITEHPPASLQFDRDYLGVHRSDDCVFLQITLNGGRTVEMKQRFYQAVADGLHEALKLRREDVFISLVEVSKENWSFGNGEAQYASPPPK
jgi:4-oxalocrotonate tautomerase